MQKRKTTLGRHHHHIDPAAGDRKVLAAVGLNMLLTLAQFIGAIFAGSLALAADALHNLSDAMALTIAFAARKIARRPADADMTFGYGRAEPVAALINLTSLVIIALYLVYEAVFRMFDPTPIDGWIVVVIATIALIIDLGTAALTFRLAEQSMNIRAAFLHNVADALGSIGVIIAGICVIIFGWVWVDPIVTLLIAAYILRMVWAEFDGVVRMLMLGRPPRVLPADVIAAMCRVDGVASVHHVQLWQLDEHRAAVQAHVVLDAGSWGRGDAIKTVMKAALAEQFDLSHVVLELECAIHACDNPALIGAA